MTFLTKPSLVVKKTPLIDGKCDEEVIQMQQGGGGGGGDGEVWTTRRSHGSFFWMTLTTFLVTLVGITTGLMLYRHYLAATTTQRYTRFCTIPIQMRDSAFYEPNYRVMPLRWSTAPDVQVFSAAAEDLSDDVVDTLREEFDIGDSVEKISVIDNGRQVSFIHDFDANVTGIVDTERCFTMELDGGVVVPPGALVLSIARGALFDVSRVRSSLRAELPPPGMVSFEGGFAGPLPGDLLDRCRGKPLYRLTKDDEPIIRKRSADAPPHDYIQFSGRHVQEIEITNLGDLLQHEQPRDQH